MTMKKVFDHYNELAHAAVAERAERIAKLDALDHAETWFFAQSPETKQSWQTLVANGDGRWLGLACDKCETEVWLQKGLISTDPPQCWVQCHGCGHRTIVPA